MRCAEAHALLAAHDTALPGLSALLDDAVLTERLGVPSRRSYLRYKRGTSALALVDAGGRAAIASAHPTGGSAKRAKALKHIAPQDVLLDAPEDGLLVIDAMADRHLPALRHLVRNGHVGAWLTRGGHPTDLQVPARTLSHKPGRRWVGSLPLTGHRAGGHAVLRAYTTGEFAAALAAHDLLDRSRPTIVRLPRILRTRHRRALIAVEHLPGSALDGTVDAHLLHRLGAGIGQLHAGGRTGTAAPRRREPRTGVDLLAPAVEVTSDAADIQAAASAALRPSPGSTIHGDLSLDQVIADGDHLGVIDLDRARVGNPLDDLASLLAVAALESLPRGGATAGVETITRLRQPLLDGHASMWGDALGDDLAPRTALALLDRAGEPFRHGHPHWPEVTHALLELAGQLADGRVLA